MTSRSPPPNTSTGTTTDACTENSASSHQSSTKPTITTQPPPSTSSAGDQTLHQTRYLTPASLRTGNGSLPSPPSGDQDDKSPVTGDCHAGICGSPGVRS